MRMMCAALLLLLTACSSSPTTSYYQLPAPAQAQAVLSADAKSLYVEPIQVASYLNGRGLVLQLSDVELVMARQHLWAEALESQLQRQLRDRLLLQTTNYAAALTPAADTLRITVQLEQFHGQAQGYAIASGRFAVSSHAGSYPFTIREALKDDGYPALVSALANTLEQLSQQIAVQLNKPL